MTSLAILGLSLALVIGLISRLRVPPFLALMAAAMVGELLLVVAHGLPYGFAAALGRVTTDSGVMAGRLGLTIAFAAVIGAAMTTSGAADTITSRLVTTLGERLAAFALLMSGFLLSVPIFVDTVMLLLLPIARSLSVRTGRGAVLYLLAVGIGAAVANGTVPPAPGPLFTAETLKLNLGSVIVASTLCGILPALAALGVAGWLDRRMRIEPRPEPVAAEAPTERPGLLVSLAPVAVPLALIAAASLAALPVLRAHVPPGLGTTLELLGDKNIALALGALLAIAGDVHRRRLRGTAIGASLAKPIESAGVIILIVAAGAAYGKMIERSGLGAAVQSLAGQEVNLLLLGWGVAALMRVAQGSATVAVITAVGVVQSVAGPAPWAVHPFYVLLAVGYGSKFMPWMNDVSFWLFCRLGGLTPPETLRSWTVSSSVVALLGLAQLMILSRLWPHLPF